MRASESDPWARSRTRSSRTNASRLRGGSKPGAPPACRPRPAQAAGPPTGAGGSRARRTARGPRLAHHEGSRITEHGPPRCCASAADPQPGPGEVASRRARRRLNFADLLARVGLYPEAPKPPCVVGTRSPASWSRSAPVSRSWRWATASWAAAASGGYAELVGTAPVRSSRSPKAGACRGRSRAGVRDRYAGLIRYGSLRAGERRADPSGLPESVEPIAATRIAKLVRAEVYARPPRAPSTTRSAPAASITRTSTARSTSSRRCAHRRRAGSRSASRSTRSAAAASAQELPAAAAGRAAGLLQRLRDPIRRAPQPAAASLSAEMPRHNVVAADEPAKSVSGLNMLVLGGRQAIARRVRRAASSWLEGRHPSGRGPQNIRARGRPGGHRRHERRNVGKVVLELWGALLPGLRARDRDQA